MKQFNEMRASELKAKRQEETDVDVMTTRYHGMLVRLRDGHKLGVYCVQWADDGRHLVSSSHDGSVIVWDVEGCDVKVRRGKSKSKGKGKEW